MANVYLEWRNDWNKFVRDVFNVKLDTEQQRILRAVQEDRMVSVCSGVARGKDFVAACSAMCFMYLTPEFDLGGRLIANTKVALTAPSDRQIKNIMYPEIIRLFNSAKVLPGRLVGYDIRTDWEEWFLTGFKADEYKHEVWSGFHAANTMFIISEASGISDDTFAAIEGNLQGNSKILLVFNPNNSTGYAAKSMSSSRWSRFRLDCLNAPNVLEKKVLIKGQVDYEWVKDKVDIWCMKIPEADMNEGSGDFLFEGQAYRPNDYFRVKVRGMFPEVSEDLLIPPLWVEIATKKWKDLTEVGFQGSGQKVYGVDVAGMGRDSSVICERQDFFVRGFERHQSIGKADHMKIAGILKIKLTDGHSLASIDTIGEGAGTYSRLLEQGFGRQAISCKYSEGAKMNGVPLTDSTGQIQFLNMRAYLYWSLREWLNPANNTGAAIPPDDDLLDDLREIKYFIRSDGKIQIESKDDIKKRRGCSPDFADSLANTFYPYQRKRRGIRRVN